MLAGERARNWDRFWTFREKDAPASFDHQVFNTPFGAGAKWLMLLQNRSHLAVLMSKHGRNARLKDSRLLSRDQLQGLAEPRLMIVIDGRDHGELRHDDIRRVQTSAETNFHHRDLDVRLSEKNKCHR